MKSRPWDVGAVDERSLLDPLNNVVLAFFVDGLGSTRRRHKGPLMHPKIESSNSFGVYKGLLPLMKISLDG